MTLSDAKDIGEILVQFVTVVNAVVLPWLALKMHQVQKQTNGLVKHAEDAARAAGKAEGKAEQKGRDEDAQ